MGRPIFLLLTTAVPTPATHSMSPFLSSPSSRQGKLLGIYVVLHMCKIATVGKVLFLSWPLAPLAAIIGREETNDFFRVSCLKFAELG